MKNQEIDGFERTKHRIDSGIAYCISEDMLAALGSYWETRPRRGIFLVHARFLCSKKEAEDILKMLQEAGFWRWQKPRKSTTEIPF